MVVANFNISLNHLKSQKCCRLNDLKLTHNNLTLQCATLGRAVTFRTQRPSVFHGIAESHRTRNHVLFQSYTLYYLYIIQYIVYIYTYIVSQLVALQCVLFLFF